jgi:ClpX C4-type zinc finger
MPLWRLIGQGLRSCDSERYDRSMSWQGRTFTPDPDDRPDSELPGCSFCGKPRHAVAHIVCGPTADVAICDRCIALAAEIVAESGATPPA